MNRLLLSALYVLHWACYGTAGFFGIAAAVRLGLGAPSDAMSYTAVGLVIVGGVAGGVCRLLDQ